MITIEEIKGKKIAVDKINNLKCYFDGDRMVYERIDNKMKVVYKAVGQEPTIIDIAKNGDIMREFIDGYLEVVPFAHDVLVICDEEGKLKEKPLNFKLFGDDIVGDVLFVSHENGDFKELSQEQIDFIFESFRLIQQFK